MRRTWIVFGMTFASALLVSFIWMAWVFSGHHLPPSRALEFQIVSIPSTWSRLWDLVTLPTLTSLWTWQLTKAWETDYKRNLEANACRQSFTFSSVCGFALATGGTVATLSSPGLSFLPTLLVPFSIAVSLLFWWIFEKDFGLWGWLLSFGLGWGILYGFTPGLIITAIVGTPAAVFAILWTIASRRWPEWTERVENRFGR